MTEQEIKRIETAFQSQLNIPVNLVSVDDKFMVTLGDHRNSELFGFEIEYMEKVGTGFEDPYEACQDFFGELLRWEIGSNH